MFSKQGNLWPHHLFHRLWRLTLLFLFLAFEAFANPPQNCLDDSFYYQKKATNLLNFSLKFLETFSADISPQNLKKYPIEKTLELNGNIYKVSLDLAYILKPNRPNHYYNHIAIIWRELPDQTLEKILEILWDSKKTGVLPGGDDSLIRAKIQDNDKVQNFLATYETLTVDGKNFYQTDLKFSEMKLDKTPLQRGVAEIFFDEKGETKISLSKIGGDAKWLPIQMTQSNCQTTWDSKGYVFLRREVHKPIETAKNQDHFCYDTPGKKWIDKNSREWDEFCLPLFDKGHWHGFSFNLIPFSYESFLKN